MNNTGVDHRLWSTAYHEAGHAVAAHRLGLRVTEVNVIPAAGAAGNAYVDDPLYSQAATSVPVRELLERYVCGLLAGGAAEMIAFGTSFGDGQDFDDARVWVGEILNISADDLAIDDGYVRFEQRLWERAKVILSENWRHVQAVAGALVDCGMLGAEDLAAIIAAPATAEEPATSHASALPLAPTAGEALSVTTARCRRSPPGSPWAAWWRSLCRWMVRWF